MRLWSLVIVSILFTDNLSFSYVLPTQCTNNYTSAALGSVASKPVVGALSSTGRAVRRAVKTMAAAPEGITIPAGQAVAVLGGGCFWCLEACYQQLKGVSKVVSGYAGGHVDNPTYEQVCGKKTGHAEVIAITYDPASVSFKDLLEVFFTIHDPTTKDRQGNDAGPQYRSIILYTDEEQKKVAEEVMAEVTAEKLYPNPLVTELVPLTRFWPGELPLHLMKAKQLAQQCIAYMGIVQHRKRPAVQLSELFSSNSILHSS
eukprot:gene10670-10829_t